jgi:hypothetical protein
VNTKCTTPEDPQQCAAELAEWRRDLRNARARRPVPHGLNSHPKDRTLFARIDAVLGAYDRTRYQPIGHTAHER